jgi:predicted phage terminase large subunit-like protein
MYRQQATDVWIERMCDLIDRYKPQVWAAEKGVIDRSVGPFLKKRQRERRSWCHVRGFASSADKPTRARAIQGMAAMDGIILPTGRPWLADFLSEVLAFPSGKHDDIPDALSLLGRLLHEMRPGTPKPPAAPQMSDMPATITPGTGGTHIVTIAGGYLHPDEIRKRQERAGMWRDRHGVLRRAD